MMDPLDGSLLVFGGFVGTLRSDMLRLVSGNCTHWGEKEDCLGMAGPLCVWREDEGSCVGASEAGRTNVAYSCPIGMCGCGFVCYKSAYVLPICLLLLPRQLPVPGVVYGLFCQHKLHME